MISDWLPARSIPWISILYKTPLISSGVEINVNPTNEPPFNSSPNIGRICGELGSFPSTACHVTVPDLIGSLISNEIESLLIAWLAIGDWIVKIGAVTSNMTLRTVSELASLLALSVASIIML